MPDSSASSPSPTHPTFREYLWPAWWIWIVLLGTGGAAYVMFAPISVGAGLTAGIVVAALLVVVLINHTMTSGRIEVDEQWVRVGRARIERRFIGDVAAFRGEDAHAARGRDLNGTAYMCFRGWIDPVVTLQVTDPEDATPYWITSTRRPDELLAALDSSGS
ncbi:DUF3093 domain-containing protein [Zhihengliuella flava]|uniref:DUF3093 domain-containing protein n=1 Tax=Zhihengliuella flava TaxID=1285193 RepID=A0A931GGD8_9MICC|nr:DUF3093 domain-containing protein [Zhihengliuella flava]MBG6085682.1 hypothetical protein [Zhihengliuella flava]